MLTINENGNILGAIHYARPDSTRDTTANYLFNVTEQSGAYALVIVRAPAFDTALAFVRGMHSAAQAIEDWDTTESAPDYTIF